MNAHELYRAGRLTDAIQALNDAVRAKPTDIDQRSFLAELLCIAGNLERADAQLETIEKMSNKPVPSLGLVRQLVRAEKVRVEVARDGRVPEYLGTPPEHAQLLLRARVALRAGDGAEAARLFEAAEAVRPHVTGRVDGTAFADLRDLDDLSAGVLEVLTSTGRHFLVPFERVASIVFDKPVRPLDLLWRPADVSVREGPQGKVFVPAIYAGSQSGGDAALLGRTTDWTEGVGGLVSGIGLRCFFVDDADRSILEITSVEIDEPTA